MPDRQDLEAHFLANLRWIDQVVGALARRYAMSADDRDDVGAWVKMKLVEDDYAVLAKFRGASSLRTYLATVVTMLVRDYQVRQWGRWRPSAVALRRGPLAVRLETLVYRDRMPLAQAGQLLRSAGECTLSDLELARMLAELPRRAPLRPVGGEPEDVDGVVAPDAGDPAVVAEARDQWQSAERALDAAIAGLPADDQVILRLHYWQGLSVADIARALRLDQRPLYRRFDRLLSDLHRRLEAAGLSRDRARELLDESAA